MAPKTVRGGTASSRGRRSQTPNGWAGSDDAFSSGDETAARRRTSSKKVQFGANAGSIGANMQGFGSSLSSAFGSPSAKTGAPNELFGSIASQFGATPRRRSNSDAASSMVNGIVGKQRASNKTSTAGRNTPSRVSQGARNTTVSNAARNPSALSKSFGSQSPSFPTKASSKQRPLRGRSQSSSDNIDHPARYQALKNAREKERANAIANGFLADPDRPRSLAEAITPVGTCQEKCAEFERLERIVQNDVWEAEKNDERRPDESRMVKKFRRAAAGIDEQLPSDLRPPGVLKETCDYLFNELLDAYNELVMYHHFIWDRTRAIRNDFSIQQLSKTADVRIAIDSYERIARFHILSLHIFTQDQKPYDQYDAQQEREQLDKTLLSLMQYYDDSRGRLQAPNEAEFRAYCIIFQIQDPVPDLEDRVQTWPAHIVQDRRVQKALEIYAAACNTIDSQGPLRPRVSHPVAQANWSRFWKLVFGSQTSFLMSCVAEMYFTLVRQNAMSAINSSYRKTSKRPDDWTIPDLVKPLGFEGDHDADGATRRFCESYGFIIGATEDDVEFVDLSSIKDRRLPDPNRSLQKPGFNFSVDDKRQGRSFTAVINGMSVKHARHNGEVNGEATDGNVNVDEDADSMFWPASGSETTQQPNRATQGEQTQQQMQQVPVESSVLTQQTQQQAPQIASPWSSTPWHPTFSFGSSPAFGQPSNVGQPPSQTTAPSPAFSFGQQPTPAQPPPQQNSSPFAASPPVFNFGQQPIPAQQPPRQTSNPFSTFTTPSTPQAPPESNANPFAKSASQTHTSSPFTASTSSTSNSQEHYAQSNPFAESPFATPKQPIYDWGKPNGDNATTESHKNPDHARTDAQTAPSIFGKSETQSSETSFTQPAMRRPSTGDYKNPFAPKASSPLARTPLLPSSSDTSNSTFTKPHSEAGPLSSQSPFTFSANTASKPPQATSTPPPKPSFGFASPTGPSAIKPTSHSPSFSTPSAQAKPPPIPQGPWAADIEAEKRRKDAEAAKERKARDSATLDQLARALVTDQYGFLDQYLEFAAPQMIRNVRERIELRRDRQQADQFRLAKITTRYALRWRDICWKKRLAAQGKSRRQRMRADNEERERLSRESSVSATVKEFQKSMHAPPEESKGLFGAPLQRQSSARKQSGPPREAAQDAFGNSVLSIPPSSPTPESRSRRAAIQGRRRVVQASKGPFLLSTGLHGHRPGPLSRSSRLRQSHLPGDSIDMSASSSVRADTTRSTYFKLKAMGVSPTSTGKRPRSDSEGSPVSAPAKRITSSYSPPAAARGQQRSIATMQKSRQLETSEPVATGEDEELFASIRQARQAMSESVAFFQEEVHKDEEFRKSGGSSNTSSPNAGLAAVKVQRASPGRTPARDWKAIAEERIARALRDAKITEPSGARVERPPAYRNRVSKFLPRERYADVLLAQRKDGSERERYVPRRYRPVEVNTRQESVEQQHDVDVTMSSANDQDDVQAVDDHQAAGMESEEAAPETHTTIDIYEDQVTTAQDPPEEALGVSQEQSQQPMTPHQASPPPQPQMEFTIEESPPAPERTQMEFTIEQSPPAPEQPQTESSIEEPPPVPERPTWGNIDPTLFMGPEISSFAETLLPAQHQPPELQVRNPEAKAAQLRRSLEPETVAPSAPLQALDEVQQHSMLSAQRASAMAPASSKPAATQPGSAAQQHLAPASTESVPTQESDFDLPADGPTSESQWPLDFSSSEAASFQDRATATTETSASASAPAKSVAEYVSPVRVVVPTKLFSTQPTFAAPSFGSSGFGQTSPSGPSRSVGWGFGPAISSSTSSKRSERVEETPQASEASSQIPAPSDQIQPPPVPTMPKVPVVELADESDDDMQPASQVEPRIGASQAQSAANGLIHHSQRELSPPPLKRQRSEPEATAKPRKIPKKQERNFSANRFELLAPMNGDDDGDDSSESEADSLASQPQQNAPVQARRGDYDTDSFATAQQSQGFIDPNLQTFTAQQSQPFPDPNLQPPDATYAQDMQQLASYANQSFERAASEDDEAPAFGADVDDDMPLDAEAVSQGGFVSDSDAASDVSDAARQGFHVRRHNTSSPGTPFDDEDVEEEEEYEGSEGYEGSEMYAEDQEQPNVDAENVKPAWHKHYESPRGRAGNEEYYTSASYEEEEEEEGEEDDEETLRPRRPSQFERHMAEDARRYHVHEGEHADEDAIADDEDAEGDEDIQETPEESYGYSSGSEDPDVGTVPTREGNLRMASAYEEDDGDEDVATEYSDEEEDDRQDIGSEGEDDQSGFDEDSDGPPPRQYSTNSSQSQSRIRGQSEARLINGKGGTSAEDAIEL